MLEPTVGKTLGFAVGVMLGLTVGVALGFAVGAMLGLTIGVGFVSTSPLFISVFTYFSI